MLCSLACSLPAAQHWLEACLREGVLNMDRTGMLDSGLRNKGFASQAEYHNRCCLEFGCQWKVRCRDAYMCWPSFGKFNEHH